MNLIHGMRLGLGGLAIGGVALLAVAAMPHPAQGQASFVENGRAGFVITNFAFALSPEEGAQNGACPSGITTRGAAPTEFPPRNEGESDAAYGQRALQSLVPHGPNGEDLCQNPEAGQPDPNWHNVAVSNTVHALGIDLDGQVSRANGRAAPGTCAHDDFTGFHGERGIDNQFYRAVGCASSYQPGGQSWDNTIELRTGSWGLLITIDGIDDIRNDNDVIVGVYGNADPIQLDPNREPLPNVTYAIMQNARFQATSHGRIVNGVLTTSDPMIVRSHKVTAAMYSERELLRTRLRLTISPDGTLEGVMAGYQRVDNIYNHQFGFRDAIDANGQISRLRFSTAIGNAATHGFTCHGAYFAMQALADGDPDPATGRCTSISTQYQIRAIPAYVVNTATSSANDALESRPPGHE